MGQAKTRKALGLPARPSPAQVRRIDLDLPKDLSERLDKLCPTKYDLRDWLVGALAAFADWAEQEKERQESSARLVQPYRALPPKLPPGSLLGGRA